MKISLSQYADESSVGKGSFGVVCPLRHKLTGDRIARKKINITSDGKKDGVPPTLVQEVGILQRMRHRNVVRFLEARFEEKPGTTWNDGAAVSAADKEDGLGAQDAFPPLPGVMELFLFMEYVSCTLLQVIKELEMPVRVVLGAEQIRTYTAHLLAALDYLSRCNILHLDIKPANLLISAEGVLKVTDFSLSRDCSGTAAPYSATAVTVSHRAPEIFAQCLRQRRASEAFAQGYREERPTAEIARSVEPWPDPPYGFAADVWSAGCVLVEMHCGRHPLFFPGGNVMADEQDAFVLRNVADAVGHPGSPAWAALRLPEGMTAGNRCSIADFLKEGCCRKCVPRQQQQQQQKSHTFPPACPEAQELASLLLTADPARRPSAREALRHRYFTGTPLRERYPPNLRFDRDR